MEQLLRGRLSAHLDYLNSLGIWSLAWVFFVQDFLQHDEIVIHLVDNCFLICEEFATDIKEYIRDFLFVLSVQDAVYSCPGFFHVVHMFGKIFFVVLFFTFSQKGIDGVTI